MVKNIIFDLGGVLLNIDFQLAADAFKKLGFTHFEEIYSELSQASLFDDFEMGKIYPPHFRDQIRRKIKFHVTDNEIDKAWNSMLLDLPGRWSPWAAGADPGGP